MAFGQGWQRILKDSMYINSACNDYDGGYLLAGRFTRINAFGIIKTDAKGRKMWAKQFPDVRLSGYADRKMGIRQSPDSLFILYGSTDSFATNYGFSLRKLDRNGNILWEKVLPLEYGVLRVTRNDYVVMGKSITTSSQMILRLNLNGDIIFQKINQATQVADFEVQRDGLFCVDFTNASTFRLNFEGQLIRANGQLAFNPIQPGISKVVQLSDSSLCVTHNGLFVSKNTKNGDSIWTRALATYFTPPPFSLPYYWDFVPSENGGFVGVDRTSRANGAAYLKYDKDGNIVWNRLYPYDKTVFMATLIKCSEGGYLMVGMYDYNAANKPLLIKINEDGFVYPNYVEGKVVRDMDKNCQITATDPPFKNCIVEVKNSQSDVFWGITDPTGRYSINVDTGNYTLKAYPLQNRDYWQSCTPSVSKTFSSLKRVDTVDFALKPIIDCPAMDVHITTPILRRCFTNTYVVNYANKGTIVANNAYLNVTLDSLLEFVSASKTVTYRTGCTLRFNLGNVGVGDDGRFDLTTRVRCGDSTRLGQTLC